MLLQIHSVALFCFDVVIHSDYATAFDYIFSRWIFVVISVGTKAFETFSVSMDLWTFVLSFVYRLLFPTVYSVLFKFRCSRDVSTNLIPNHVAFNHTILILTHSQWVSSASSDSHQIGFLVLSDDNSNFWILMNQKTYKIIKFFTEHYEK